MAIIAEDRYAIHICFPSIREYTVTATFLDQLIPLEMRKVMGSDFR
jgi:hypothetical protein